MADYYILFGNCIPVKGVRRSIICDLQNDNYSFIPNDLYDILTQFKGKDFEEIIQFYGEENRTIINSYFSHLEESHYVYKTTDKSLSESLPSISFEWDFPAEITNGIVDFNDGSTNIEKLESIIIQLDDLNCKYLQFRFFDKITLEELDHVLSILDTTGIMSVEVLVQYYSSFEKKNLLKNLLKRHKRLLKLVISNAKTVEYLDYIDCPGYIFFITENISSEKDCGKVSSDHFACNIGHFTESLKHNTCLNRKVSIDVNGNIRNCPSMSEIFGNISNAKLKDVILHSAFRKYWGISKDDIEVCKDCEFRYICSDCRAYIEKPGDILSKPLKCGYNPQTCEWENWSTHPFKQEAISYYKL